MLSASDVLKILEEIPLWKVVSTLPKRVAELERKIAALEATQTARPSGRTGRECPFCDSQMKVTSEHDDPTFGFAGVKSHIMQCPNCDKMAQRQYDPKKGYVG